MSISNIRWSPDDYQSAAVIAAEASNGLLARLSLMTIEPAIVLDLGCGVGELAVKLQTLYPKAKVLAADLSHEMLQAATSIQAIQADAQQLPFSSQSFDLIVANFLLPWCDDRLAVLKECHRVLRPQGVLIFTALGPDTLQEYRGYLDGCTQPNIIDMHDLGDELVHLGFADPVLDVDYYTTVFKSQEKMLAELKSSGMLVGKDSYDLLPQDGEWQVTYELIHGHSWMPVESAGYGASSDGTVSIPLSVLRRQLRSGSG